MLERKNCLFLFTFGFIFRLGQVECYQENTVSLADQSTYSHNSVRDLHGVQHLVWDAQLALTSQAHSEYLAERNSLEHSQASIDGSYGENVYKGFDGFKETKTIADAVFHWYLEIEGYDFTNGQPDLHLYGHFTALVWRQTSVVGCGYSTRSIYQGLMTYIVCQYLSQGNVEGQYLLNVLPLRPGAQIPRHPQQLQAPIGCIDVYERCHMWYGVCQQQAFRGIMLQYCKKTCRIC